MDEIPSKIELTEVHNASYHSMTGSSVPTDTPTPEDSPLHSDSREQSPVPPTHIKAYQAENTQQDTHAGKSHTVSSYIPYKEATGDHGLGDTSMYDDDENTPLVYHKSDVSNLLEKAVNQSQATPLASTYNFLPPLGVDEKQFINQTAPHFKTSTQRYTQVLIWCLVKRTQRASTPHPRKSEVMKGVYEKLKRRLASNEVKPRIHTPSMTPLKPRVANPENNHLRSIIKDLSVFKKQLQEETAEHKHVPERIFKYEPGVEVNQHGEEMLQAEVNGYRTEMHSLVGSTTDKLQRLDELSASANRVLHRTAEKHMRTHAAYLSQLMSRDL